MAADIHALANALDLGRIYLVGHDIGGMVACAYAAQWPSEVRDLTMIEMLLPGYGIEAMFAVRQPERFAHMPFFMAQDLPEWLLAGKEAAFLDWFIRNNIVDQSSFSADTVIDYASTYARPGALRAAFDWFRAFWQDAEDNRTAFCFEARHARTCDRRSRKRGKHAGKSLQPLADKVRGIVFEGSGHLVPDEQPARLAQELRRSSLKHELG